MGNSDETDTPWRDRETFEYLYCEERMTTDSLAERWGVGQTTTWEWLHRHGIEPRKPGVQPDDPIDPPWRDAEILERMFVDEGMSTGQIADELGCGTSCIRDWLSRHGIRRAKVGGDE